MKKYRKITDEDIETHYKVRYTHQYNEVSIGHSPHRLRDDIVIGPNRKYTLSNLIKKLKHK